MKDGIVEWGELPHLEPGWLFGKPDFIWLASFKSEVLQKRSPANKAKPDFALVHTSGWCAK